LKNPEIIQKGIEAGKNNLNSKDEAAHTAGDYYNLANGYHALFRLTERKIGTEVIPQSQNLQKAKFNFRSAIKHSKIGVFNCQKLAWVNYGNCLSDLGRGIEAIYAYDNALKIDKNFSMAIGSKARELQFFADISMKYREAIYVEAYQALKSIIEKPDLIEIGGASSKKAFESELKRIEGLCKDKELLARPINYEKYDTKRLSKFELFYIDFCVKEKLFLNFHVHHEACRAAIIDPIFISIVTKIDDMDTFYIYAKHINQIKEDYAVARLLLVQSQFKRRDFDRISKRTTLINTLDYSQFNLYLGLLKTAFEEAYNILDKIAVFINDYYKFGLPERDIYFDSISIWEEKRIIRKEILTSKNISLYALYDIYCDFKSKYYAEIKKIRNASTHRRLVIFDSTFSKTIKNDGNYNISLETMLHETISLLRLTKSAIIYLINFVNMEENKKKGNGLIAPMVADSTQFL